MGSATGVGCRVVWHVKRTSLRPAPAGIEPATASTLAAATTTFI